MKKEVRTRQVDIWRSLPIIRSADDAGRQSAGGQEDDDEMDQQQQQQPERQPSTTGRGGRSLERSASMVSVSKGAPAAPPALERVKSITAVVAQAKAKEIPVPQIDTSAEYETMVDASYQLPKNYIRTKKPTIVPGAEVDVLEYNLEMEDEEWLQGHKVLGPKGELAGALDVDRMEKMIDELEKATNILEALPLPDAESVLEARLGMQPIGSNKTVIAEVYSYWCAKRARLKKPLLRRFWPVTSINDNNPHAVFRPREKERYKLRKHRKNDGEAYRRLQLLRRDFGQVQKLLMLVKRREQMKLAALKLQEEQYLQTIAEMCGQQRKPKIPKEAAPVSREDLKLKFRMPPGGLGDDGRPRKKRAREEEEGGAGARGGAGQRPQQEINPEVERLRKPIGWGTKEKEGALPTPDYIPSFMEQFRFRQQGRAPNLRRKYLPFSDEGSTTYGWRPSTTAQGGKIGHVRSGLVTAPRCLPIDYDADEADTSVRYQCRARLARGGRIVFDRVPIAPKLPPLAAAGSAAGAGAEAAAGAGEGQDENLEPPSDVDGVGDGSSAVVVVLSAADEVPQLEKYPTLDLNSAAFFTYPRRFEEVKGMDDTEEEVLELNPAAPSDPDPLLTLPPRPKPPETDAVVVTRFELPV